jgi:hypothetical protein
LFCYGILEYAKAKPTNESKKTEITETHVIVDFHERKKHGETVPPLKMSRKFYGVEEYLIPYLCKPKRAKPKTLYTL